MNTHKNYDVLRLIEHNQICYVSSDNVRGNSLVYWIKYHPYLQKKQMLRWIYMIVHQLTQIHKCRGNPCYQYVNPYSIIVTEDGKLCFLDIGSEANQERIRFMQRKCIKSLFLPDEEAFCQKTSEELDIYGLGKTLQYLLNFVEVEPGFTRKEEKKLRKLIARCIDKKEWKRFKELVNVQTYLYE